MADGSYTFEVNGQTINVTDLASIPSSSAISAASSFRVLEFNPTIDKICNRSGCQADRTKIDSMISTMRSLIAKEK